MIVAAGGRSGSTRERSGGADVVRLVKENCLPTFIDLLGPGRRRIAKALDEITPDITHYQAFAWWPAHIAGKNVLTVHGVSELDSKFKGARPSARVSSWLISNTEGRSRQSVQNVIAISEYTVSLLMGNAARTVWKIENPISNEFFGIDPSPQPGRMLVAGMISPLKNTLEVIHVASRVASNVRPLELRIAGWGMDTSYGHRCLAAAKALPPRVRVTFLGPLSVPEMVSELSQAELLVLASLQENAPMVIAEALAAGVPVLAACVGGVPEMVEEGRSGRMFRPGDRGEMIAQWQRLVGQDDLKSMGIHARCSAQRFRASVVAEKTLSVYRAILARDHDQ